MSHERRVARNTSVLVAGGLAQVARGLLVTPLVTRALGVVGYGRYAAAFAVVSALSPIVGAGVAPILTREIVRRPDAERELVGLALRRALAIALALWAALVVAAYRIPGALDLATASWLGLLLPAAALGLVGASASARLRDARVVAAQLAGSAVLVGGTLWALARGAGAAGVAAATAAGAVIQVAATSLAVRRLRGGERVAEVRLWRDAAPSIATSLAVAACVALDIALVEWRAGPASAGVYAGASRLSLLALIVPQALAASLLPSFAAAPHARPALKKALATIGALAATAALTAPLYAPLVPLVLGDAFAPAAALLPWCAWRVALMSVATIADGWLLATGAQTRVLACHLVAAATSLAGCVVLVPSLGARGAAIAVVVAESLKLALLLVTVLRAVRRLDGKAAAPRLSVSFTGSAA